MPPVIYFVRHGETDWNAEARLQGQRDIPLNEFGRVQADEAGLRLQRLVGGCDALDFVASPLGRTRETMERLRAAIQLDPSGYRADDRLKELTFGSWEGFTWKEVRARDPQGAAMRGREKWSFVPPGGESYEMLAKRVMPAILDLTRDSVVVSHGGVARALLVKICNLSTREAPSVDIWQGKVLVFEAGRHRWA